jgi:DNA-binding transcriptional LysR family regulator
MQLNASILNLLIALDALLREKNVTRAAERVFVSQPAMSAALHKLREYFNDPSAGTRGSRNGAHLARLSRWWSRCAKALLRIQMMLGTHPTFDPEDGTPRFHVIMSEGGGSGRIAAAAAHAGQRSPRARRAHRDGVSDRACHGSNTGEADLCLCLESLHMFDLRAYPDSIRSMPLRSVKWVCAVSKDHPTVGDTLTLDQYIGLQHMFGRPAVTPAPRISWCATC